MRGKWIVTLGGAALASVPAVAQQQVVGVTLADSGDTAWVLVAALLVLMMTVPGLALFYSGQVAAKNKVTTMVHCLAILAAVSLIWVVLGYSIAFSEGSPYLGGIDNAFLAGLAEIRADTTIPESAFALFQMMVACFAPALIVGACVERVRFGWLLAFATLWSLLVYAPIAHWLWGNGWLAAIGAHDFAGGLAVSTSAGVSALCVAAMIGRRGAYSGASLAWTAPELVLGGAGLLWLGWLGMTGAATLAAGDDASTAIINIHVAACAGGLTAALIERVRSGRPTAKTFTTGALTGLAITAAAAGFIGPIGAIALGLIGGVVSWCGAALITNRFVVDDALNVFAIQGLGGITGASIFPLFVLPTFGGPGFEQGATLLSQFGVQAIAVGAVVLWSALASIILGYFVALFIPMRVSERDEQMGLDAAIGDILSKSSIDRVT